MAPLILKILTIALLFVFNSLCAQEIWREDFPIPEKGIWGSGDGSILSDFSGITTWTLSYSDLDLSDSGDYAKTVSTSGGRFEACDIDGEIVWRSEWIDISFYDKVKVQLTAAETGSGANTATKYLKAFCRIDKGEEILFYENGVNAGNWGSATACMEGLAGETLQIVCYISTHYASDKVILKDVMVIHEAGPVPPVEPFDVVINELMADPNPPVGLPETEYIELFNRRDHPVDIENWELRINAVSKRLPKRLIEAGDYLILCATGSVDRLLPYGNVCGVTGFQGLLNRGAVVEILDNEGKVIDHITYSDTWYGDKTKQNGGWSLERIDPSRYCNQQENWKASRHADGGTPGRQNSLFGENPDVVPLSVKWAVAVSETSVELCFSESADTFLLGNRENYILSELGTPLEVESLSSEQILLRFALPFQKNRMYLLQIDNLTDECGNPLDRGQYEIQWNKIETGDIVINELLFDPFPGGEDFVELYNLSDKMIDLSRLRLANRNKQHELNQVYRLTEERRIFKPYSYLALTMDTAGVFPWFSIWCPSCFLQMDRFPSYPNSEGVVVILNDEDEIIDQFFYNDKMHSPFLADTKGISLERVSFSVSTNTPGNWHSAATGIGYGTPGYENSQAGEANNCKPAFTFEPEVFSPDNDGFNNVYLIRYKNLEPGYVVNIKVFDVMGRFVFHLAKNELLGSTGTISWNGYDKTGQKQRPGVYIVLVELFNSAGDVHRFKDGFMLTAY